MWERELKYHLRHCLHPNITSLPVSGSLKNQTKPYKMNIYKSLLDYYERCIASGVDILRPGTQEREMHAELLLAPDGTLVDVLDLRKDADPSKGIHNGDGEKVFVGDVAKNTNSVIPKTLWGTAPYISGCPFKTGAGKDNPKKGVKAHKAFLDKTQAVRDVLSKKNDAEALEAVDAVLTFYSKYGDDLEATLSAFPSWNGLKTDSRWPKVNVTFRLDGKTEKVAEIENVIFAGLEVEDMSEGNTFEDISLMTGELSRCGYIFPAMPLPYTGGMQPGASPTTFKENRGLDSWGFTKCENAPVDTLSARKIVSAWKRLTRYYTVMVYSKTKKKDVPIDVYPNAIQMDKRKDGDNTVAVFWVTESSKADEIEQAFFATVGRVVADNPDRGTGTVRKLWESAFTGIPAGGEGTFNFVIFKGDLATISLRDSFQADVKDVAKTLLSHFDGASLPRVKERSNGLLGMLETIYDQIEPPANHRAELLSSVVHGTPYPRWMADKCISKLCTRADAKKKNTESEPYSERVALLKADLIRNGHKVGTVLDESDTTPAYLAGRLFALMAHSADGNATTFVTSNSRRAMERPSEAFGNLLPWFATRLGITKCGEWMKNNLKRTGEYILSVIRDENGRPGFPSYLDRTDRELFWVGWYHQRETFYESKENREKRLADNPAPEKTPLPLPDETDNRTGFLLGRIAGLIDEVIDSEKFSDDFARNLESDINTGFAILMSKVPPYIEKIDSKPFRVRTAKMLDALVSRLGDGPLPSRLEPSDRAAFWIGRVLQDGQTYAKGSVDTVPSLPSASDDPGYLSGRLFAILEYASGNDRYLTSHSRAMSVNPKREAEFLMKLYAVHLKKFSDPTRIWLSKMSDDILGRLPEGLPERLSVKGQSTFWMGYSSQRNLFFTKKKDNQIKP